jgi:hypothetical protein
MPEDPEEHVALMFHGLVSDLQTNDVARFEEEQRKEREARAALRHQDPYQGLSASELLKKIDGDPAEALRKVHDDLARINKEAQAAVAEKDKQHEVLPEGHFPPPPTSE